jgi:baseplate protein BppL
MISASDFYKWMLVFGPTLGPTFGYGPGDVVGPDSSTDNTLARFNGDTGKEVKGSAVEVDDDGNITTLGLGTFGGLSTDQIDTTDANVNGKLGLTDFSPTMAYVATSGNDGNNGQIIQPFRNINSAVQSAADGTQVNVSPGTYAFTGNFQMRSGVTLKGQLLDTTIYNVTGNILIDQSQWTEFTTANFVIEDMTLSATGTTNYTATTYQSASIQSFVRYSSTNTFTAGNVGKINISSSVITTPTITNVTTLNLKNSTTTGTVTVVKTNTDPSSAGVILIEDVDFSGASLIFSTSNATKGFAITIRNCRNLAGLTYNNNSVSIASTLSIDLASYPSGGITDLSLGLLAVTFVGDYNLVHKTGNETIAGTKTFTDPVLLKEVQNPYVFNLTPVSITTTGTLTAAQLIQGCIVFSGSAAATSTLPLGSDIDTILNAPAANRGMRVRFENQSDFSWTISANTGMILTGLAVPGFLVVSARSSVLLDLVRLTTNSYNLFGGITGGYSVIAVTGTSKTLALTDQFSFQACSNSSTQTITIPLNSSAAFPIGTTIELSQQGVGQVVMAAVGGVTLNSVVGAAPKSFSQYNPFSIKQVALDSWIAYGALTS